MLKPVLFSFLLILFMCTMAFAALNINTADVTALQSLKGIGAKKANAIVEYRESHGPYQSVDDLTNVRGIGPKLLEKIRRQVEVGPSGESPSSSVLAIIY